MTLTLSDRLNLKPGQQIRRSELAQMQREAERLEQQVVTGKVDALWAQRNQTARLSVHEKRTYSATSKHSFFVDLLRSGRTQDADAQARLQRHSEESMHDQVNRMETRARAAERAYEQAFYSTPADRRAVDAYIAAGGRIFEQRAMTRVDGSGGYLAPPGWLIDQYVAPARAGTELASLFTTLPLPRGIDEVNVPRMLTGTGTGSQAGDIAPDPGRDMTDAFVSAVVRQISGVQDIALQWVEQGSGAVSGGLDKIIYEDLQADAGLQLDGQLMIGSGSGGQLLGLLPSGTTIGTSLAVYAPNGNTSSGQTWSYNGSSGTPMVTTTAQLISGVARARGRYPTHLLSHPWVFAMIGGTTDQSTGRPLIEPHGPHPAAADAEESGVLGHVNGLPFVGDFNVPVSFGGTTPPALAYTSGAQFTWTAGTGASALYTPVLALHAPSLYLWLGDPQIRVLEEVLNGTLQVRIQLYQYAVALPNRYQAVVSGTLANSGGWTVGACSAYGAATQQGSNSVLSLTGWGG
jgi:hypothetical protein